MSSGNEILYIKGEKNTEVKEPNVTLGDILTMECSNSSIMNRIKPLRILKIPKKEQHRYVVSVLKIIECIHREIPGLQIQNEGESDLIITYEGEKKRNAISVENLSASTLPVGASYLQSREVCTLGDLYSMGTGVTAVCDGKPVRCGSFAAPLYGENAADASVFTLNLTAGRGALLHCFCAVPDNWQTLELTYHPDFAAGRSVTFTLNRSTDRAVLGVVPTSPAEVGSVVDL